MEDSESLAHVRWECKYHVIFIPKYRKKVIFGSLRVSIGQILRELCDQKEIGLLEGHAMNDHQHLRLQNRAKTGDGARFFHLIRAIMGEIGEKRLNKRPNQKM